MLTPQLDFFVDRDKELAGIEGLLDEPLASPRILVWQARPASGLTSFFRYSRMRLGKNAISIYIDCLNKVANTIFAQVSLSLFNDYNTVWQELVAWIGERLGDSRRKNVTLAGLAAIPWIGQVAQRSGEEYLPKIEQTHFPSAAAEVLCEFLIRLTKEHAVLVLIDNAQEIDAWSTDLLRTTMGRAYEGLTYVAGFVERRADAKDQANWFFDQNRSLGYDIAEAEFPAPNGELVQALCQSLALPMTREHAFAIAEAASGNFYHINAAIRRLQKDQAPQAKEISQLGQEILAFAKTARQALRESDILALCASSELFMVRDDGEIQREIEILAENGLTKNTSLPDGDRLIEPLTPSFIAPTEETSAQRVVRSSHLYEYFLRIRRHSRRHSLAEVLPLLYRLSKEIADDQTPKHVQDLITLSLQMGGLNAAERFIQSATLPDDSKLEDFTDFLAKAAFLLSIRRSRSALKLLQEPAREDWKLRRVTKILEAIALNRSRQHSQSESLLAILSKTATSSEELALLTSYRISGRLHENDVSGAREIFSKYTRILSRSRNYGYFLRNASSAFETEGAIHLLTTAAAHFKREGDLFGLATTLSNRGARTIATGDLEAALSDLSRAYNHLEVYGIHHLHIVLNNLGICHLKRTELVEAEEKLLRALALSHTSMPTIYIKTNLAATFLLTGRPAQAIDILNGVATRVERHPVDRVRQRFYPNAALMLHTTGSGGAQVQTYCEKAREHPDRLQPETTAAVISVIGEHCRRGEAMPTAEFVKYFNPCFLSYWHQNPLEALPPDLLSGETVLKDLPD